MASEIFRVGDKINFDWGVAYGEESWGLYCSIEQLHYDLECPTEVVAIEFWVNNGHWDGTFYPRENKLLCHYTNETRDVSEWEHTPRPLTKKEVAERYVKTGEGDPQDIIKSLLQDLKDCEHNLDDDIPF